MREALHRDVHRVHGGGGGGTWVQQQRASKRLRFAGKEDGRNKMEAAEPLHNHCFDSLKDCKKRKIQVRCVTRVVTLKGGVTQAVYSASTPSCT